MVHLHCKCYMAKTLASTALYFRSRNMAYSTELLSSSEVGRRGVGRIPWNFQFPAHSGSGAASRHSRIIQFCLAHPLLHWCLRATSIVYSALVTAFCGSGCRRKRSSATESPHRRRGHCCTVLRLRGLLLSGRLFSAKFARMLGMQLRPDLEHLTEWFSRSFNIAKPNSSDVYRVRFAYELSLGFFNYLFATPSRICQLTAHSLFVLCQTCVFSIFVSPNLHRSDCQEQLLFWGF